MKKKDTRSLEELALVPSSSTLSVEWANKALQELGYLEFEFDTDDPVSTGHQLMFTLLIERIRQLENDLKQIKQEKMNG